LQGSEISIAGELNSVTQYIVDVNVFDDHAKGILEEGIKPGE